MLKEMSCCVSETMGFVDKLFESLSTKNYLGPAAVKEVQKEEVKPVVLKSDIVEVHEKPKLWLCLQSSPGPPAPLTLV